MQPKFDHLDEVGGVGWLSEKKLQENDYIEEF